MSWNMLTYAFVAKDLFEAYYLNNYVGDHEVEEESRGPSIENLKAVAIRILNAENNENSPYYSKIQGLLSSMSEKSKNVESFVTTHLKFVFKKKPFSVVGQDSKEMYYVELDELVSSEGQFWETATSVYIFLENNLFKTELKMRLVIAVTSLAVTILTTSFLNWTLLPCFVAISLTRMVTAILAILSVGGNLYDRASDFAIKHLTETEKKDFLQLLKKNNPNDSRIEKIKRSLASVNEESDDESELKVQPQ